MLKKFGLVGLCAELLLAKSVFRASIKRGSKYVKQFVININAIIYIV